MVHVGHSGSVMDLILLERSTRSLELFTVKAILKIPQ